MWQIVQRHLNFILNSPVVTTCTAQWSLYVPHSGNYTYRTVVTICTSSLTFNNSTFCPHSVSMCFVWIWEQTAIISLYNINWLVFITEMESVYWAVRAVCLEKFRAAQCCHHSDVFFTRTCIIFILFLPEGRAGEIEESSKNGCSFIPYT